MSSQASVNVMLGLEDAFDIEFPDRMLTRAVFESIASIRAALTELLDGEQHEPGRRARCGADRRASARSPARSPGRTPPTSTTTRASRPRRSTHCARQHALSAFVPTELGGAGASFETIAECCFELGRYCGATAMVFAMHQIQLMTIVRHIGDDHWFNDYLRELVAGQRLIASVTSEVGTGGDMGRSIAAVMPEADGYSSFEKQAPTVSYGAHSDDLLTTLAPAS